MLQNASYMFFLKEQNKTKRLMTTKKRKKVSPGKSRTRDLRREMVTHNPLPHATIADDVCQINCNS